MPTSAERAYKFIRSSILAGRFGSGMRLKEQEIAGELAISRTPVRDAIRRLHSDGLIEFEPNHNYTYFTLSQLEEDLSGLLRRKVDVHVPKLLHPYLRDKVLGQAEALYVGS